MTRTGGLKEREVEAILVAYVKRAKGEVRKVRWIGRVGAPDRLVLLRGTIRGIPPMHLWVEVKSSRGRLSPEQVREFARFAEFGMQVHVVRSKEDVLDLIYFGPGSGTLC